MSTTRKTIQHNVTGMRQVTEDQWADFLLDVAKDARIYGTEMTPKTLDHIRGPDKFHLATVVYHDWPKGSIVSHHVTTQPIPTLPKAST